MHINNIAKQIAFIQHLCSKFLAKFVYMSIICLLYIFKCHVLKKWFYFWVSLIGRISSSFWHTIITVCFCLVFLFLHTYSIIFLFFALYMTHCLFCLRYGLLYHIQTFYFLTGINGGKYIDHEIHFCPFVHRRWHTPYAIKHTKLLTGTRRGRGNEGVPNKLGGGVP